MSQEHARGLLLLSCFGMKPCCNLEGTFRQSRPERVFGGLGSRILADSRFTALGSKQARDMGGAKLVGSARVKAST